MPEIVIDSRPVTVEQGMTVLDAARKLGIRIPTLCFPDGCRAETSCMVCVVKIDGRATLVPACATKATDGMVVESETTEVKDARRTALDLLLGEHVGDCEAPCQRACPAHMDIPQMIRQIADGKLREAIVTVKRTIALPAVLGRICPAPCEKACRRSLHDSPVSICLLKRFAADRDMAGAVAWLPACKPASGKKVAVVGAGPTGLSAAYYLLQEGHGCTIFDERAEPGGMLRHGVPEDDLPRRMLDAEVEVIRSLGAEFRMKTVVGKDVAWAELEPSFDAVVLAVGTVNAVRMNASGVEMTEKGIKVDAHTHQTSRSTMFSGGDAIQPVRLAVRAVGHGKDIARSVSRFLNGEPVASPRGRFNCRIGKLKDGEMDEFLKEADRSARNEPQDVRQGFSSEEAVREAGRCLRCDCRKSENCRLRDAADACGATQQRYAGPERTTFKKVLQHDSVVYEPGKCIRCGLCVQVTEMAGERLGLTFLGRGFDAQVGVPFNESLAKALEKSAQRCVDVCPTAALAKRG